MRVRVRMHSFLVVGESGFASMESNPFTHGLHVCRISSPPSSMVVLMRTIAAQRVSGVLPLSRVVM